MKSQQSPPDREQHLEIVFSAVEINGAHTPDGGLPAVNDAFGGLSHCVQEGLARQC